MWRLWTLLEETGPPSVKSPGMWEDETLAPVIILGYLASLSHHITLRQEWNINNTQFDTLETAGPLAQEYRHCHCYWPRVSTSNRRLRLGIDMYGGLFHCMYGLCFSVLSQCLPCVVFGDPCTHIEGSSPTVFMLLNVSRVIPSTT